MKTQKKYEDGVIEKSYMNRLPIELWWQILSLLPVKTLLILRAVCKSFLSIVNDSDFISFHLNHFPDNTLRTRLITFQDYIFEPSVNLSWFDARSVNPTSPIIVDEILDTPKLNNKYFLPKFFLDGLVLLSYTNSYPNYDEEIVLWNPSIRKYRQLSPPDPQDFFGFDDLILGYHKSCNDYKILSMDTYTTCLYSLETGDWTDISLNNGLRPHRYFQQRYDDINFCDDLMTFNEGVVWIAEDNFLVWFDFGTQRFRYSDGIFYPIDQKYRRPDIRRGLVKLDGGSSVGMWGTDVEDQPYIWALNIDSMSWTKRYKISRELVQVGVRAYTLSFVERNGELVWKWRRNCLDSIEILSYDIGTQAIKSHLRFNGGSRDFYIQSLFMLN